MSRKKRREPLKPAATGLSSGGPSGNGPVVAVLALMMVLAPGLGVPHELMLQDTFKSIVVSFAALGAGLLFCWHHRQRPENLHWHAILWLPLALMAYALGSMAWSHAYLAGVEAVRWFILSLLLWLGLNSFTRERLPLLAWGIHTGAVIASFWTALQFWFDFSLFTQGPNPASTFVNRNFFAEFAVCTLPLSALLLATARTPARILALALSTSLILVAIFMTGTRSALLALVVMLVVLPVALYRCRDQLACLHWPPSRHAVLLALLIGTVAGLGSIPTGNPGLIREHILNQRGDTALTRAWVRGQSAMETQEYTQRSFAMRLVMWKATARMIAARPLTGVGAGAWEVDVPLYQADGSQLETDYYAHNEILQLLAEYGLAGWLFLLGLLAYLARAAWTTWRNQTPAARVEAPWRVAALGSLLMFLIVSNAGFPSRMASTGALFALLLAMLAASDARLSDGQRAGARPLPWKPAYARVAGMSLVLCTALAAFIAQQAAACESRIVRAVKLAITITQSGDPFHPRWRESRRQMLTLVSEGIAINPHYRKITPMVADELAQWGDWRNAIWIWESVVESRPHVVAILANIARGHAQQNDMDQAMAYLERARQVQPRAPAVASLEVILLGRAGREAEALQKARVFLAEGLYDYDLLNAVFSLGARAKDWPLAIRSMELRNQRWPAQAVDGWLRLGHLHARAGEGDEERALQAFRAALAAAPQARRPAVREQIPAAYRSRL